MAATNEDQLLQVALKNNMALLVVVNNLQNQVTQLETGKVPYLGATDDLDLGVHQLKALAADIGDATNYLKVESTGVSLKGDLNLATPNGLNSFQLSDLSWGVNLTDNTDFVQFDASPAGQLTVQSSQDTIFSSATSVTLLSGLSGIVTSASTGVLMLDETGGNSVTLNATGLAVAVPHNNFTLTEYASNALALAGGLVAGDLYHTAGVVMVVI